MENLLVKAIYNPKSGKWVHGQVAEGNLLKSTGRE
jgi:hypothetical protein